MTQTVSCLSHWRVRTCEWNVSCLSNGWHTLDAFQWTFMDFWYFMDLDAFQWSFNGFWRIKIFILYHWNKYYYICFMCVSIPNNVVVIELVVVESWPVEIPAGRYQTSHQYWPLPCCNVCRILILNQKEMSKLCIYNMSYSWNNLLRNNNAIIYTEMTSCIRDIMLLR